LNNAFFPEKAFSIVSIDDWIDPTRSNYANRLLTVCKIVSSVKKDPSFIKSMMVRSIERYEYCKQSSLYPRGYYYPNPIASIIVSNENRGSLKKNGCGDEMFIYGFNAANELSLVVENEKVNEYYRKRTELLISFHGFRIGVEYLEKTGEEHTTYNIVIEAVAAEKKQTSFMRFNAAAYSDYCIIRPDVWTTITFYSSGLPVKQIEYGELVEDVENVELPYSLVSDGFKDAPFYTMDRYKKTAYEKYELEYDPQGYPLVFRWNGKECPLGRRKKPVLNVVYGYQLL
jgi:hypothetical protein